jgi:hypothetical protein
MVERDRYDAAFEAAPADMRLLYLEGMRPRLPRVLERL